MTQEIFDFEYFSSLNNKKLKYNALFNFGSVRIPYLAWGKRVWIEEKIVFDAVTVTDVYCFLKAI